MHPFSVLGWLDQFQEAILVHNYKRPTSKSIFWINGLVVGIQAYEILQNKEQFLFVATVVHKKTGI